MKVAIHCQLAAKLQSYDTKVGETSCMRHKLRFTITSERYILKINLSPGIGVFMQCFRVLHS